EALVASKNKLFETHDSLADASQEFEANVKRFALFMESVEGIGDGLVDGLAGDTSKAYTFADIEPRWIAADGAMESRIEFLERVMILQSVLIEQSIDNADLTGLQIRLDAFKTSSAEFLAHPSFD